MIGCSIHMYPASLFIFLFPSGHKKGVRNPSGRHTIIMPKHATSPTRRGGTDCFLN